MSKEKTSTVSFLEDLTRRRGCNPSQLATDLGINHATVSRWLSGAIVPSLRSCHKLADYSGVPIEKILCIVDHLTGISEKSAVEWPEFREYARHKYPTELNENFIDMIENIIEQRRVKNYGDKNP